MQPKQDRDVKEDNKQIERPKLPKHVRPNPKFKPQFINEAKTAQNMDSKSADKQVETGQSDRRAKNPKKLPPLDYKIHSADSKCLFVALESKLFNLHFVRVPCFSKRSGGCADHCGQPHPATNSS